MGIWAKERTYRVWTLQHSDHVEAYVENSGFVVWTWALKAMGWAVTKCMIKRVSATPWGPAVCRINIVDGPGSLQTFTF